MSALTTTPYLKPAFSARYALIAFTFTCSVYEKELASVSEKIKNNTGAYLYLPTITENDTMIRILNKYGISEKKCRMQILNSIETDATNLQMQCQGRRKSIWRRDLMHF